MSHQDPQQLFAFLSLFFVFRCGCSHQVFPLSHLFEFIVDTPNLIDSVILLKLLLESVTNQTRAIDEEVPHCDRY